MILVILRFLQTSAQLVGKCKEHNLSEVVEQEFVRVCSIDSDLGTVVLQIYRAFIGSWSFLYERWESGVFFTQTKPPKGGNFHFLTTDIFTF